ncbi:MAG: DNA repair protein RadC [Verrucomicrobia bacterium]|nr:DNA repair protein RadC [Verrucomicrobiota bacterium]
MNSSYLIRDMPFHNRPRERLIERGADTLRDEELIAILLRTGRKGLSVIDVAGQVLKKFGRLGHLAGASIDELCQIDGIGPDKAATLKAAFEFARRMARELREDSAVLDTPERIAELLREEIRHEPTERFQVVLLNIRRRLIRVERLAQGTQDTLLVQPREVFRCALLANAAAIVLVHNHPSGDPTPSEADIKVTRDLIRAGQLLKIDVVDHVILGRATSERPRDYVSLRELGCFFA